MPRQIVDEIIVGVALVDGRVRLVAVSPGFAVVANIELAQRDAAARIKVEHDHLARLLPQAQAAALRQPAGQLVAIQIDGGIAGEVQRIDLEIRIVAGLRGREGGGMRQHRAGHALHMSDDGLHHAVAQFRRRGMNREHEVARVLQGIFVCVGIADVEQNIAGVARADIDDLATGVGIRNDDRAGVRGQVSLDNVVVAVVEIDCEIRLDVVGLVELFGDDAIVDAGAQHGAIAVVVAHVDLREHHIVGVLGRVVGLSIVIRIRIGAVLDGALLGIADGAGLRHLALADHHAVGATNGVVDRQGFAGLLEQAHGGLLIAGERIATLICGVIVGAPLVGGNRNIDISRAFIRRDRGEEVGGIRRGVLQRDEHIQVVGSRDFVAVRVKLQPHLVALLKLRVQLDGRGRLIRGLLIAHEVIAGDGVVARLRGRIGGRELICVADADADIEQSGVKRQFSAHFLLVRVDHRKLLGAGLLAVDFRGQDAVLLCSFRRINRSDAVGDGRALALAALLGQGRQDVILTLLQRRSDRGVQRLLVVAIEVNGNIVILAVAQRDLLQVNGDIPLGLAEVDLVQIGRHGAVGQLGAAGARDGIRQGQTVACGRDDIQVKRLAACVVVFAASVRRGEVFNRGVVVLGVRAGIQLGQGVAGVVAVLHGNQQIITVCDGIIRNRIHGAAHRQRRNLLQLHGGGGVRLVAESIAEVQLRAFNCRAIFVNRAQPAVVLHCVVAVGGCHFVLAQLSHQENLERGIAGQELFVSGVITVGFHELYATRRTRNRLGLARCVALGQGRDKAILGIVGQPRIDIVVVATQERGASDQRIRGIQVFHVDRGIRRFLQHDVRLAADILDRHFILADGGAGGIGGARIGALLYHSSNLPTC